MKLFSLLVLSGSIFISCVDRKVEAQEVPSATVNPGQPPDESKANNGESDLEQATRLRISADSIETLDEIIKLSKSAIDKGLDEVDTETAKRLIAASAFQKAKEKIEQSAKARPSKARLAKMLGEVLEDLNLVIENEPSNFDAYTLMAQIHVRREEFSKASDIINKSIEEIVKEIAANSQDQTIKDKLTRAYLMRSELRTDVDDRLSDLDLAIKSQPSNQLAVQARVQVLLSLSRNEEAVATLQEFLDRDPENLFAIVILARTLMGDLERPADAIELLTKKIELLPNSGDLYRLRGQAHLVNNDEANATLDLNKAIEISGVDVEAKLYRASLFMQNKKYDEARKEVDEVLQISPNLIGGIRLRASIAAQQERLDDAISDLMLLVRNAPDDIGLLLQLGSLYQMAERPESALKTVDRVIAVDEKNWQAYRLRGDIRLSLGEHETAIADYEIAIAQVDKQSIERSGLLNNLAWVLATSPNDSIRDGKRALELGLEACELTKYEEAHILSTLAAAYAESGQFDKALEWSEKAVELGKNEEHNQLEQLESELESYRQNKPWRELQETKEKRAPIAPADSGIDA